MIITPGGGVELFERMEDTVKQNNGRNRFRNHKYQTIENI